MTEPECRVCGREYKQRFSYNLYRLCESCEKTISQFDVRPNKFVTHLNTTAFGGGRRDFYQVSIGWQPFEDTSGESVVIGRGESVSEAYENGALELRRLAAEFDRAANMVRRVNLERAQSKAALDGEGEDSPQ